MRLRAKQFIAHINPNFVCLELGRARSRALRAIFSVDLGMVHEPAEIGLHFYFAQKIPVLRK